MTSTTPAEREAVLAVLPQLQCDHAWSLYDPYANTDELRPTRPTLRNTYRLTRASCVLCDAEADHDTVRELREELDEALAEQLL